MQDLFPNSLELTENRLETQIEAQMSRQCIWGEGESSDTDITNNDFSEVSFRAYLADINCENTYRRKAGLQLIIHSIAVAPKRAIPLITEDAINNIVEGLKNYENVKQRIALLGLMTNYSPMISDYLNQSDFFVILRDHLNLAKDEVTMKNIFIIAQNIIIDTKNPSVADDSGFFQYALTYDHCITNDLYSLMNSCIDTRNMTQNTLKAFIVQYIQTIAYNGQVDEKLVQKAIQGIRLSMKGDFKLVVIQYIIDNSLINELLNLLEQANSRIVGDTLAIIRKCINHSEAFCALLINIDLVTKLFKFIGSTLEELQIEAIATLQSYQSNTFYFSEQEARKLLSFNFKELFQNGSVKLKFYIVNLIVILLKTIRNDGVFEMLDGSFIEEICDLCETNDVDYSISLYQFFVELIKVYGLSRPQEIPNLINFLHDHGVFDKAYEDKIDGNEQICAFAKAFIDGCQQINSALEQIEA